MTGPEHYLAAERTLETTDEFDVTDPKQQPVIAQITAEAQVHATLALAAATALNDMPDGVPPADWQAWMAAAGTGHTQ